MQIDEAPRDPEPSSMSIDVETAVRTAAQTLQDGAEGLDWVRFALQCRDSGHVPAAESILSDVIRYAPIAAAYYELAFLHRLRGEHREAVSLLRSAGAKDDARVQMFLGHMLHAVGAHPEAESVLDSVTRVGPTECAESDAMHAFGRYVAAHPLGRSLCMLDQVSSTYGWLETDDLADRIAAAVQQRRPFAMVRLGDGEGSVLRLGQNDEFNYRPLYERNRDELIAIWFGNAFEWRTNGFIELADELLDELLPCDVLGIPYESWLTHEYKISSLRGIPSLVNIYRALLARPHMPHQRVCSQLAHLNLYTTGRITRIIADARRISVITCLSEIGNMLRDRLGLEEVVVHHIPGEQGSSDALGPAAVLGTHYPTAFMRLQAELSRPHDGRLFLIAGGILGKFYAATIRKHGGIALDIGSLVDAWTGRATRPGFDDQMKL
jgi:tetratricopeptide (TPR) repeat protein